MGILSTGNHDGAVKITGIKPEVSLLDLLTSQADNAATITPPTSVATAQPAITTKPALPTANVAQAAPQTVVSTPTATKAATPWTASGLLNEATRIAVSCVAGVIGTAAGFGGAYAAGSGSLARSLAGGAGGMILGGIVHFATHREKPTNSTSNVNN